MYTKFIKITKDFRFSADIYLKSILLYPMTLYEESIIMYIQNSNNANFWINRNHKTASDLQKSLEKLSSGYAVNRAADNAAGLAVSEKMRSIIAGLNQGIKNINDGINYVHSVDGASQQIHNVLHRLTEIATQAANGTYCDDVDRRALDCEYQQLLDEIDQMTDTMNFNGVPLFDKHLEAYGLDNGNVMHEEPIIIDGSNDELCFGYTVDGKNMECKLKLAHGRYISPEELADIIDSELYERAPNLIIGVDEKGRFTIQAESGTMEYISGSGSSLFFETKMGSKGGYLLGVTEFLDSSATLRVKEGENDDMRFRLSSGSTLYSIKLDAGYYNHSQLIQHMNQKLEEAGLKGIVTAVPEVSDKGYGIIALESEDAVTGLSGNFIKMDSYHSPIYDISCYAYEKNTPAVMDGKKVLSGNIEILRGRNDYFNLTVYDYETGKSITKKITLLDDNENVKNYASINELADRINKQLEDYGMPAKVTTDNNRLKITSDQFGDKCVADIDENDVPSGFMLFDLFDAGTLKKLTPTVQKSSFSPAYMQAYRQLDANVKILEDKGVLKFNITQNGSVKTLEFNLNTTTSDKTYTRANLVKELNTQLKKNYASLDSKLDFKLDSDNRLILTGVGAASSDITRIVADSSSSAYNTVIKGVRFSDSRTIINGTDDVIYSTTSPNGSSVVQKTKGSTTSTEYYTDQTSKTTAKKDSYVKYSTAKVTKTDGTTTEKGSGESQVGGYEFSPATAKIEGVASLFDIKSGKSIDPFTFSVTLLDEDGKSYKKDISVAAGKSFNEAISEINTALSAAGKNGSTLAVATRSGNDLILTSGPKGDGVSFSNISGTMVRKATKNSLANQPGAVISDDMKTVTVPPSMTIPNVASNFPLKIDSTNNKFIFSNGSKTYTLTLQNGNEYTSVQTLAGDLQTLIDAADGGNRQTTVKVSDTGNGLVLVGSSSASAGSSFSISSSSTCPIGKTLVKVSTSSPYYDPVTKKVYNPATMVLSQISSHLPFKATSSNNKLIINYKNPGGTAKKVEVTLQAGTTYDGGGLANAINTAAGNGEDGVIATYSNGKLTLTTKKGGAGAEFTSITGTTNLDKYKMDSGDVTGGVIEGDHIKTHARLYNYYFSTIASTANPLAMDSSNNKVSMTIDGTTKTFSIFTPTAYDPTKVYTSAQDLFNDFKTAVNKAFGSNKVDMTYSNGTLTMTSKSLGTNSKFVINSTTTAPVFKRATAVSSPYSPYSTDTRCNIVGQKSAKGITINDWESDMTFTYTHVNDDGTSVSGDVNIDLSSKFDAGKTSKTYANVNDLVNDLQELIDDSINGNNLEVYSTSGGAIGIRGATSSTGRAISNFQGHLFDKVFQAANYTGIDRHRETAGTTLGSTLSYIIGRNDLEPESEEELESGKNVKIFMGTNDEVAFDFTYNGKTQTVSFNLDPGDYTKDELAAAIQEKGRNEFAKLTDENGEPFPDDFFNASIGLSDLGVPENDTGVPSEGKLVLWCRMPKDGTHDSVNITIDGVRGNSAYRVFYDATRSPSPTTILGSADLSNGITIKHGVNDSFTFDLDGKTVDLTIGVGNYTCEEMCTTLNMMFISEKINLRATAKGGRIMFYSTENGKFNIDKFRGSGAKAVFYGTESRETDTEIGIHTGRRTDSYIWFKKTRVDDHLMRINTTGVTTQERARKAMDRLVNANNYLSMWRGLSGANENRSVHVLNRQQVYIENLSAAESGIRDLNMAKGHMDYLKQQLIMQAQQTMFSTIQEQQSSILDLFV